MRPEVTDLKFKLLQLRRSYMHGVLRSAVSWSPLADPEPGYTVIIGCRAELIPLLAANLRLLQKQDQDHLYEVIAVVDQPGSLELQQRIDAALTVADDLPLRVLHYTPQQLRRARWARTAWAYSWMSWSLGIAATRTRYAMLHDLDAMLLEPSILRTRYETIVARGDQYLGHRFYNAMGVESSDRLAATYELMLDARYVREHFRPIDLFNKAVVRDGRRIHYDTFLWAQHQHGRASVLHIPEEQMVHPSQMICQFTELMDHGRQPRRQPNLPLMPYLFELGGDADWLAEQTVALERTDGPRVPFRGRELNLSGMTPAHAAWLRKQAGRLEAAIHGYVRDKVTRYFDALDRHCPGEETAQPAMAVS